jgi:predicted thioredoxin/glutaredoxin
MHIYTFLTKQLRVKISLPKTNKTKKNRTMVLAVPSVFDNGKLTFPIPQITYA